MAVADDNNIDAFLLFHKIGFYRITLIITFPRTRIIFIFNSNFTAIILWLETIYFLNAYVYLSKF